MRSGGREAIAEVLARRAPLVEMLWTRETEAGGFDTPERRAALEARIDEVVRGIGDEAVRKYYRQDFGERLRQLFDADAGRSRGARPGRGAARARRLAAAAGHRGSARAAARRAARPGSATARPYVVASPQLAASPIVRGFRTALPPREALILLAVVNHPWLLRRPCRRSSPSSNSAMPRRRPAARRAARLPPHDGDSRRRRRCGRRSPRAGTPAARPGREAHHHASRLAGARPAPRPTTSPMVDPRCYLASQVAHVK